MYFDALLAVFSRMGKRMQSKPSIPDLVDRAPLCWTLMRTLHAHPTSKGQVCRMSVERRRCETLVLD
jgi:hypothetical protein